MRVCPTCKGTFPAEANFCPEDGSALESDDPLIGTTLLGQFQLRNVCGTGAMGTVYLAWQSTMEREVAVKILRPELVGDPQVVKRFHREARAAARLSHPNIVASYLVGDTDDGRPFIVMEYVDGHSLDQLMRTTGAIPAVRAIHIARQIASALQEAHANGIIHRDLKPQNILLSQRRTNPDQVKVLDFGIAKILYDNNESQLTQTGAIFGTPYYLSPEQASGAELDPRCDLYSLGVILFQMVTGRLPFTSASGMEVLIQHLKQDPPRPREIAPAVPHSLEELILKALRKAPEERWASAEELADALGRVVDELCGAATTHRPGTLENPIGEVGSGVAPAPAREGAAASWQHPGATVGPFAETPPRRPPGPATRPAVSPIAGVAKGGDANAPARDDTTAPVFPRPAAAFRDSRPGLVADTGWLQQHMLGRRRVLRHVVVALLSVLLGGSAGAAYFYLGEGQAAPPPPAAGSGSTAPAAAAHAPAAHAGSAHVAPSPPAAKAKAAAARPTPAVRRGKTGNKPLAPVGPDPKRADHPPRKAGEKKAGEKKAGRKKAGRKKAGEKTDGEIYELVD